MKKKKKKKKKTKILMNNHNYIDTTIKQPYSDLCSNNNLFRTI